MFKRCPRMLMRGVCLPVDLSAKIKFAMTLESRWDSGCRSKESWYPPPPSNDWNHRVSKKFRAKFG